MVLEIIIFAVLLILIFSQPYQPYELEVSILISVIEIILLILLLFIIQKKWKSKKEESISNVNGKIVELLSLNRHDFMNHLQVILGYTSLKKTESISKYVTKIYNRTKEYSMVTSFVNANLAAYFYLFPVNYPKLSIDLELVEGLQVQEKLVDGDWVTETLNGFLNIFHQVVENNVESNYLYISVVGVEDKIIFIFEFVGFIENDNLDKIAKLGEDFNKNKGLFQIDLHNEEEFIMELHFPLKNS